MTNAAENYLKTNAFRLKHALIIAASMAALVEKKGDRGEFIKVHDELMDVLKGLGVEKIVP